MPKREDVRHKDYMDAFIKLKNKQNLVYSLRHIESYIWTLGNKIINALNNEDVTELNEVYLSMNSYNAGRKAKARRSSPARRSR